MDELLNSEVVFMTAYVPGGCYDYLTLSGKHHVQRLCCDWMNRNTLSHIQVTPVSALLKFRHVLTPHRGLFPFQRESAVRDGGRVINGVLEGDIAVATGAVVQHCHLQVRRSSVSAALRTPRRNLCNL